MFEKILVGTDGSDSASRAVARAVQLAASVDAELVVVHVHPPSNVGYSLAMNSIPEIERGKEILRDVERRYGGELKLRTVLREGEAAGEIIDLAEEEGVDLIVVGNKGMAGSRRFLVGSVPNRVSHHARCDVLIIHTVD
jgi:nucleotide-binding universal stress UspA family protein